MDHTEYVKSDERVSIDDLEEGQYYFFEMERVRDIFLGKLIKKKRDSERITDLVIEHTYNPKKILTETSFGVMFVYQIFNKKIGFAGT